MREHNEGHVALPQCGLRGRSGARVLRYFAASAAAVLMSACVDPSAVESFSKLAPDQSKLDKIMATYAAVPEEELQLDVLHGIPPIERHALASDAQTRRNQTQSLDKIHEVLVNYMKALGALADNQLVQTSTETTTLTNGLTNLSTAEPQLRITSAEISSIGQISTLLANAATAHYRSKKLSEVLAKGREPFQMLIATEIQIVNRGVIPDLNTVLERTRHLNEIVNGLKVESAVQVARAKERAALRKKMRAQAPLAERLNPALRGSGAADVAGLLLLRVRIDQQSAELTREIAAASEYVVALQSIDTAYRHLCANRRSVLSKAGAKAFIQQNQQLLKEAYASLQSLKAV